MITYHFIPKQGKICIECGKYKYFSEFPHDKRRKDGYTSKCKECERAYRMVYQKAYVFKNAEKIDAYQRKYREKLRRLFPPKRRKHHNPSMEDLKAAANLIKLPLKTRDNNKTL